jgi:hypothetical protein
MPEPQRLANVIQIVELRADRFFFVVGDYHAPNLVDLYDWFGEDYYSLSTFMATLPSFTFNDFSSIEGVKTYIFSKFHIPKITTANISNLILGPVHTYC